MVESELKAFKRDKVKLSVKEPEYLRHFLCKAEQIYKYFIGYICKFLFRVKLFKRSLFLK